MSQQIYPIEENCISSVFFKTTHRAGEEMINDRGFGAESKRCSSCLTGLQLQSSVYPQSLIQAEQRWEKIHNYSFGRPERIPAQKQPHESKCSLARGVIFLSFFPPSLTSFCSLFSFFPFPSGSESMTFSNHPSGPLQR